MALKAGSVSNFTGSMAEAMEQAFQNEWNAEKDISLGEAGEKDRKILFAAIAQGLMGYLKDNINDSLKIDVSVTQQSGNQITSSGPSVTVAQNSGTGNRVESDGQAIKVELVTE